MCDVGKRRYIGPEVPSEAVTLDMHARQIAARTQVVLRMQRCDGKHHGGGGLSPDSCTTLPSFTMDRLVDQCDDLRHSCARPPRSSLGGLGCNGTAGGKRGEDPAVALKRVS